MSGFSPLEILLCNPSVSLPFLDPEHFHTSQPTMNGTANPTLMVQTPSCSYSCRYFMGQLCPGDKPRVGLLWEGACHHLQISSCSLSGAEGILLWLHNYHIHAGVESSSLCHNPGTESCFFSCDICSSVLVLNFPVAVILSPCDHCHPVLLSVAPLLRITMGFRSGEKPQATEDSG